MGPPRPQVCHTLIDSTVELNCPPSSPSWNEGVSQLSLFVPRNGSARGAIASRLAA